MRNEMLSKYRPNSKILKKYKNTQLDIFNCIEGGNLKC